MNMDKFIANMPNLERSFYDKFYAAMNMKVEVLKSTVLDRINFPDSNKTTLRRSKSLADLESDSKIYHSKSLVVDNIPSATDIPSATEGLPWSSTISSPCRSRNRSNSLRYSTESDEDELKLLNTASDDLENFLANLDKGSWPSHVIKANQRYFVNHHYPDDEKLHMHLAYCYACDQLLLRNDSFTYVYTQLFLCSYTIKNLMFNIIKYERIKRDLRNSKYQANIDQLSYYLEVAIRPMRFYNSTSSIENQRNAGIDHRASSYSSEQRVEFKIVRHEAINFAALYLEMLKRDADLDTLNSDANVDKLKSHAAYTTQQAWCNFNDMFSIQLLEASMLYYAIKEPFLQITAQDKQCWSLMDLDVNDLIESLLKPLPDLSSSATLLILRGVYAVLCSYRDAVRHNYVHQEVLRLRLEILLAKAANPMFYNATTLLGKSMLLLEQQLNNLLMIYEAREDFATISVADNSTAAAVNDEEKPSHADLSPRHQSEQVTILLTRLEQILIQLRDPAITKVQLVHVIGRLCNKDLILRTDDCLENRLLSKILSIQQEEQFLSLVQLAYLVQYNQRLFARLKTRLHDFSDTLITAPRLTEDFFAYHYTASKMFFALASDDKNYSITKLDNIIKILNSIKNNNAKYHKMGVSFLNKLHAFWCDPVASNYDDCYYEAEQLETNVYFIYSLWCKLINFLVWASNKLLTLFNFSNITPIDCRGPLTTALDNNFKLAIYEIDHRISESSSDFDWQIHSFSL